MNVTHSEYAIAPARYAKGMVAVRCISDGTGLKTRAAILCSALGGRYTHRCMAYIMSPRKAQRFVALHAAGWDADYVSGELIPPTYLLPT